jgi:hypothetical protein
MWNQRNKIINKKIKLERNKIINKKIKLERNKKITITINKKLSCFIHTEFLKKGLLLLSPSPSFDREETQKM